MRKRLDKSKSTPKIVLDTIIWYIKTKWGDKDEKEEFVSGNNKKYKKNHQKF